MVAMTAYSQSLLSSNDSISYPIFSVDGDGTKVVTITHDQMIYVTEQMTAYKALQDYVSSQDKYIAELEYQIQDYEDLEKFYEKQHEQSLIIIENRNLVIRGLNSQLTLNDELIKENERILKQSNRRLVGWKVGTFVTIGVVVVAIPVTVGLLLK